MATAQEYADARLEHYKTLLTHDTDGATARVQRHAELWAAMDSGLRKEAAEAYFSAIQAFERTRKR